MCYPAVLIQSEWGEKKRDKVCICLGQGHLLTKHLHSPWFFSLSRFFVAGRNISISSGTFLMTCTAHKAACKQIFTNHQKHVSAIGTALHCWVKHWDVNNNKSYLFPQIGVRRFKQLLHFTGQVTTHLWRTHAAQSAQSQTLDILCAVIQVTGNKETKTTWTFGVNVLHKNIYWLFNAPTF